MGKILKKYSAVLFLGLFCSLSALSCAAEQNVRHPFVSGSFYPANKDELNSMIDGFLSKTPETKKPEGEILGFIVPHAGYAYSGPVAAYAYKMIADLHPDTVILIGVYHKAIFPGASIWRSGIWQTPLGEVAIDSDLAGKILRQNKSFGFTTDVHLAEHSLEVQVPFLQKVLKNFKIVPILISDPSMENVQALAHAISKSTQGKNVLILASTDMSHYFPDDVARKMDDLSIELVQKQDTLGLLQKDVKREIEFCGIAATMTTIETAKLSGTVKIDLLKYGNSGDATGDKERVVGYGCFVIYKENANSLSAGQKKELLDISRKTLEAYVTSGQVPEFEIKDPMLRRDRAVFVTLKEFGNLRGCIGSLTAQEPLYLAVRNMTVKSASQDPRFSAVAPSELKDIRVDISVLGPPKKIGSADEIILGKHGVIVRSGNRSGVFLPQVATETGWTKETFLNELCSQKAGLAPDCWKDPATELYTFTAFDFGED